MELKQLELKRETFQKYGTTDLNEVWEITSYDRNGEVMTFEMPLKVMISKHRNTANHNTGNILNLINQINLKSTI